VISPSRIEKTGPTPFDAGAVTEETVPSRISVALIVGEMGVESNVTAPADAPARPITRRRARPTPALAIQNFDVKCFICCSFRLRRDRTVHVE